MFGKTLVPGPARTESLHCPVQIISYVETEVVKWTTLMTPEAASTPTSVRGSQHLPSSEEVSVEAPEMRE